MKRSVKAAGYTLLLIAVILVPVICGYNISAHAKDAGNSRHTGWSTVRSQAKQLIKLFTFNEEASLREWEEKVFKDKVLYTVENDRSLTCVRATSTSAASALYYRIKLDAKKKHPIIRWKWSVEKFPEKKSPESLETVDEDDFAARVYVIFPAKFLLNSRVLEYIWAESLPIGETGTSPLSKNIKRIVVRSGKNPFTAWYQEERDIVADYLNVFGRSPEYDIGAVAFMTNTEHTQSDAAAMYTDIWLGYEDKKKQEEKTK